MATGTLPALKDGFDLIEWYATKMLDRFGRAEKLQELMDGVGASRNEILTALKEISEGFQILKAEGVQLDILGYKFGLFREGETDNVFRARIVAFGGLKLSGTVNQIIFILKILGYGTLGLKLNQIKIHPLWDGEDITEPAAYAVVLTDPTNVGDPTQQQLNEISPAGVGTYQGWFLELNDEPGEYILLNDAVEVSPGVYEGTPILVY